MSEEILDQERSETNQQVSEPVVQEDKAEVIEDDGIFVPDEVLDSADADLDDESEDAHDNGDLPEGIKARLGRQEKRHQREIKGLRLELDRQKSTINQSRSHDTQESDSYYPNQYPSIESVRPLDPFTGQPVDESTVEGRVLKVLQAQKIADQQKEYQKQLSIQKAEEKVAHEAYFKEIEKASVKYDDFEKVVGDSAHKFSQNMQQAAMFMSDPGDLIYTLAKNGKELDRINRLSPLEQMKAIVRFSEALSAKKLAKRVSKAPKPLGLEKGSEKTGSSDLTKFSYEQIKQRERDKHVRR